LNGLFVREHGDDGLRRLACGNEQTPKRVVRTFTKRAVVQQAAERKSPLPATTHFADESEPAFCKETFYVAQRERP
jgi:hypothetical protein